MWQLTLALILVLLCLWLIWRKKQLSIFKSLNIPGPEPNILFGNLWEFRKNPYVCHKKWIEKYGKIMGYYFGLRPVLLVADPELLKIIQQKEFHKFPNRSSFLDVGRSTTEYNTKALTGLKGKRWKDIRSIITPTFTTSKLKMMNPIVSQAVDELVEAVVRKSAEGKPFNIYKLYQNLTMDIIARTSLGVHTNAQKDENEPYLTHSRVIFSLEMDYFSLFAFSFPEVMGVFSFLRSMILRFRNKGREPRLELLANTGAVIAARKADPKKERKDLLQLMINAQVSKENISESLLTAGENDERIQNGDFSQKDQKNMRKMTDEEISQNALLFLLAGYETTSTALAFLTHLLLHHPEVQNKVREEINQHLDSDKDTLSYETVQKLQYLDSVICEGLRLYPPVYNFVTRVSLEDTQYENIRIPKNMNILVPVYALHFDSAYWNAPEEFDPERFLPENKGNIHPMVYQPFGAGPRNCVGLRFAQMEIKMALAKLLHKFKFTPCPRSTKDNLEISSALATMRPKKGVFLYVEKYG
ncbi:cytochrome P450 3A8-like [Stegodyphus dumicola]|uniref:cytochrome P450 3A8-like n=1 Tax=Stegodyphus dumicola TaxID=202533 RepID=UPI0015A9FCAF|nr:cytochrome P450 3A8-like [Stegodyphus dumicola]